MSLDMRSAGGLQEYGWSLWRRFITTHGSWPPDRDYGYNLSDEVNETGVEVDEIALRMEAECLKDERTESATATVVFDEGTETITAACECQTSLGPFTFTLTATSLTVKLLSEQLDLSLGA